MSIRDLSACELISLLVARRISSVEILDELVRAVDVHDHRVNAVVVRNFERAYKHARKKDRVRSPQTFESRPLDGVPMTVKEAFDVEGLATTWGLPAYRNNIARDNAETVDRLVDAGAIIFGKTNVPEGLVDCQSSNPLYGRTNNPWNTDLTCGGSSGGSAAALAAGFTPIELGSDLGGSIRTPAHFCGVFSHKPSYGLVSPIGHSLSPGIGQIDLFVVGPMARYAEDLRLVFDAIVGPMKQDAKAWRVGLPEPRGRRLQDFRVAVLSDHAGCTVDASIVRNLDALAASLRRLGVSVDEKPEIPVDLARCHHDYILLMRAVSLSHSSEEARRLAQEPAILEDDDTSYRGAVRRAAGLSHYAWHLINRRRNDFRMAWSRFFRTYDVLLCPVHSVPAFPHNLAVAREDRVIEVNGRPQDYNQYLFWAAIAGLSYLPSTVRPIGMAGDVPVGIQIIGSYLEDRTTIRFAECLDEVCAPLSYPIGTA